MKFNDFVDMAPGTPIETVYGGVYLFVNTDGVDDIIMWNGDRFVVYRPDRLKGPVEDPTVKTVLAWLKKEFGS